MRQQQSAIIASLGVKPEIDPADEVAARVDFIADYLSRSGSAGAVLGISGGQDSTLAGRLTQLACERLAGVGTDAAFVAVRLPYGVQSDADDADLACEFIRPDTVWTFDIGSSVDAVAEEFRRSTGREPSDFNKGNIKARARMMAQYAIAGQWNYRVIGSDHAAEAVTGFYTKFGDGAADLTPLSGLTKRQGGLLLRQLGAAERLYSKTPTADLLDESPGRSDEDELGLDYDDIDTYLQGGDVADDVAERIESRYAATEHKRRTPAAPSDTWWR